MYITRTAAEKRKESFYKTMQFQKGKERDLEKLSKKIERKSFLGLLQENTKKKSCVCVFFLVCHRIAWDL